MEDDLMHVEIIKRKDVLDDKCVYCGKTLEIDAFHKKQVDDWNKEYGKYPNLRREYIGFYNCNDCPGWSPEQEQKLMEQYNKELNEKMDKRRNKS